jgi:hypothetical protein
MMEDINEMFASIVGGLEVSEDTRPRYVARSTEGFTVTLPAVAREMIAELAVLAGFAARSADAPVIYDEASDQEAYALLAESAVSSGALHDCDIVKASIFSDLVTELELHAWLRVMNLIRSLLTQNVTSANDMAALRASNDEASSLLDFVGAVQHEVLEALM